MNKRGLINWAIWIGVVSGIYCAIYAVTIGAYTDNILPGWHIIYVTFTALPIYFTAGAKREEFWQYIGSYLVGVLWAMLYLVCMDRLNAAGWPWQGRAPWEDFITSAPTPSWPSPFALAPCWACCATRGSTSSTRTPASGDGQSKRRKCWKLRQMFNL